MRAETTVRELQARNAYTYHIDEFPPESAVGRCFGSSSSLSGSMRARGNEREREREREGRNEMKSRRSEQNGTRDKRIRMEIRERGREIGRVSERKKCKGEKTGREDGGERRSEATVQKGRGRCMENMDDGARRREVAEGNEREPLLQREIGERGGEGDG